MNKRTLKHELAQAGAQPAEIDSLVAVAGQLGSSVEQPAGRWLAPAALASCFIVGLILYAQTSLPGSWSYPVKHLSENAAVAVDPSYRASLMMRRSAEVKSLVGQHASSTKVLATLAAYKTEATAYKGKNYAAFEYCKSQLQQAAQAAPTAERQAISQTLAGLAS